VAWSMPTASGELAMRRLSGMWAGAPHGARLTRGLPASSWSRHMFLLGGALPY
jgi:hypothetical protein